MIQEIKDYCRGFVRNPISVFSSIAAPGVLPFITSPAEEMPLLSIVIGVLYSGTMFSASAISSRRTFRSLKRARKKFEDEEIFPLDSAIYYEDHNYAADCYGVGMRLAAKETAHGEIPKIDFQYYQKALPIFLSRNPNKVKAYSKLERLGLSVARRQAHALEAMA
jgi:hypothetical protein